MRTGARTALVGAAAALLATLPADLAAQGPGRIDLSVTPSRVAFPTPGVRDFDRGSVRAQGVTVSVEARGSVAWVLTIRSEDPDLGGYGKPLGDLQWRQPDDGWQPMAVGEEVVALGSGPRQIQVDFRTLLAWERDAPDTYGAEITLRLSAQVGGPSRTRAGPVGTAARPGEAGPVCARLAVGAGRLRALDWSSGAATTSRAELGSRCPERQLERLQVGRERGADLREGGEVPGIDRRGSG